MGDDIDFDELLAEQEGDMYDDYMDDMEAEMSMEAEASVTTPVASRGGNPRERVGGIGAPPSGGPTVVVPHVFSRGDSPATMKPADAGALAEPPVLLSSARHPSPLPVEKRLGVSPREDSPMTASPVEERAGVMRALNNDSLSPLHPVLKETSDSRWSGDRRAKEVGASSRTTAGSRRGETSGSGSLLLSEMMEVTPSSRSEAVATVDTRGMVLSRPSLECDSVPFMQSGGRMMHLRLRPAAGGPSPTHSTTMPPSSAGLGLTPPPAGNLLCTPMAVLMERVTERRVVQRSLATAEAERAAAAGEKRGVGGGAGIGDADFQEEEEEEEDAGRRGQGRKPAGGGGRLWVDKYAPQGFRELLSDEKINREVLRAVKAWDPFVFKKERTRSAAATAKPGGYLHGVGGGDGAGGEAADKRPEARVIMLCGPPGLGKTTLAQVVARHAGYNVYEINASDDRSAPVLKKRITEAMEGNTLLADKRPNLIVLDEVDGADGKAAAQVLVDVATAPLSKGTGAGDKKTKRRKALTRPLVLICNDQWTPALRPIRALAQVFVFRPRASPARLVQRLKAICHAEHLTVNTDALTRLADRAHLDVRSCLNTLQFVAKKASAGGVRNASAALLTAVAEGIKDDRKDLFQVLRSVFTRKKSGAKRRLFIGGGQGSEGTYVADKKESDVYQEVQAFNDHGKILSGVHENFLGVRFNDPTLSKAAAAMDWLEMADLMDARTSQTQDYSFSRYAPLAAAGVHYLCKSDQRATVSNPKKDYEARTARAAKNNILHSFVDGRQLRTTGRSTQAVVLDMLSHLMDILAPTLRPINPELLSPPERARFRGLVGILLSCGATFAPQSAAVGGSQAPFSARFLGASTQEFALEPAIDQLLKYEGYDFAHPTLPVALRPMVAHEVSLEAMRQAEAAKRVPDVPTNHRGDASFASPFGDRPSSKEDPKHRPTPLFPSSAESKSSQNSGNGGGGGVAAVENDKVVAKDTAERSEAAKANTKAGTSTSTAATTVLKVPLSKKEVAITASERPAYAVPFWNRTNRIAAKARQVPEKQGGGEAGSSSVASSEAGGGGVGEGGGNSKRPRGEEESGGAGEPARVSVKYQFRGGYTNAVRRPVRMRDLL